MATWWLALDIDHTSYDEVKTRKVIAQGFRAIGDLRAEVLGHQMLELVRAGNQQYFRQRLKCLGWAFGPPPQPNDPDYDHQLNQPPCACGRDCRVHNPRRLFNLWSLLRIRRGDLIIAREGQTVRGICQATQNGWHSYQYDPAYEYAQTDQPPG